MQKDQHGNNIIRITAWNDNANIMNHAIDKCSLKIANEKTSKGIHDCTLL
ncbi:MAG: hypothetical protein HRK26_03880 [Rickettsiaceae bacterium H1]|nr:hypothetical protein [Rickettsiaceae bacterium H1]